LGRSIQRSGKPALLRRSTLLLKAKQLNADTGLRHLLRGQPGTRPLPCPALAIDIDTPADLARARGWLDAATPSRNDASERTAT